MNIKELLKNRSVKIIGGAITAILIVSTVIFFYQKNTNNSLKNPGEQEQIGENPNDESSENNLVNPVTETIEVKIASYNVSNLSVAGLSASNLLSYKTKFNEFKTKLLEAIAKYEADKKDINKPEPDYFVELSRYANYLDKGNWAKEILLGYFEYYDVSSVVWNNLAALYEEEGNYLKANEYYLKILSVFTDKELWGLYYKIAKNYKLLDDMENTHIYYAKYKARGGFDQELEDYLVKYFPKS